MNDKRRARGGADGTDTMAKPPPATYWTDHLELNCQELLRQFDAAGRHTWVERRSGRQLGVLCHALGIDEPSTTKRRAAVLRAGDRLQPYYFVERFARLKSRVAALEVAREVLSPDQVQECMKSEEEADTLCLLFALFTHAPDHLKAVALLDRIHKAGAASMKLNQPRAVRRALTEVLATTSLKSILAAADKSAKDGHTTSLRGLLPRNGRVQLFLRRGERPTHVLRPTGGVIHGYRPEWIVLDFAADAKRLSIASHTGHMPIAIANRIAVACFGDGAEYINEDATTRRDLVEKFIVHLREHADDLLALVELTCGSSPLKGSPSIRLSQPDSKHLGPAIGEFETMVGALDAIETIKVRFKNKRVTIIFEDLGDAFDVRYSDHRLNALERAEFVDLLTLTHGITIHSTEKRYARPA